MEDLTTGESRQGSGLIEDTVPYHVMGILVVVLVCVIVMSLS